MAQKKSEERKNKQQAAAKNALTADQKTIREILDPEYSKDSEFVNSKHVDEELLWKAIARIAEGESLSAIAKDPNMPSKGTLFAYFMKARARGREDLGDAFVKAYEMAKEIRAESWADELVTIADSAEEEKDAIQKSRLMIDTRKWLISKLIKQYSEKTKLEHTGEDGEPIKTENSVSFYLPSNGRENQEIEDD